MNTENLKKTLANIAKMQLSQEGNPFPCPRCGHEMRTRIAENALSRYEKVYICPDCGKDEFVRGMQKSVLPLGEWAFTGMFKLSEDDLNAIDFMIINDDEHGLEIECTFECWFDVDMKFGTHVGDYEGDAFINLYAAHNPETGSLRIYGTAVYPDVEEPFTYSPSDEESALFLRIMEAGCKRTQRLTMAEMMAYEKKYHTLEEEYEDD